MLNQLLESRARRERRPGGTAASIAMHALILAALIRATANATVPHFEKPAEVPVQITPVDIPPTPVPPKSIPDQALDAVRGLQPPDIAAPTLIPPIDIPTALPDIDYAKAPTRLEDFASGRRRQLGGVEGGTGNAPKGGDVYAEWEVERPAAMRPGSRGPEYPSVLREAGVEGSVVVQFVVDTLGRAELGSISVVRSDHAFFSSAVKRALESMRFIPAEVGGRKVPQRVMQPFQFTLNR
jgi:protein TonB